jgi:hypothetical protein
VVIKNDLETLEMDNAAIIEIDVTNIDQEKKPTEVDNLD